MLLDENMTWSGRHKLNFQQKNYLVPLVFFSKLLYYLNTRVYHALFNSHLYAILCWGKTAITNLNLLQVLQNRAIRNISRAPPHFRLDNYYLNCLKMS